MAFINSIGISYKGDYINQGSYIEKCKKSNDMGAKCMELLIRNDGKDTNYSDISSYYDGTLIFHLPTINLNQTNLKTIKESINNIITNDIKLFTIDASTLLFETYDWSTSEEEQNYLKNMARGIASLSEYNVGIAIENTYKSEEGLLFGKTVSNMSDLLVYTRNCLVEEYGFSRERANEKIGISLNINRLFKSDETKDISKWLKVFYNDIKCVKTKNIEEDLNSFSTLLDLLKENNIEVPILIESKSELEKVTNEYKKLEFLVNKKENNMVLSLDGYQELKDSNYNEYNYNLSSNQNGFTNLIIIIMILITVIIAFLMIYLKLR